MIRRTWPNRHPTGPRPVAVTESTVMGRSAVATVVGFVQIPAIGQLAGVEASESITRAGPVALASLWAVTLLIAGLLVAASYAVRDRGDQRVLEVAACLLLVVGCLVYLIAAWENLGPVGALWLLAVTASLAVTILGRAGFLIRQVLFVGAMTRTSLDEQAAQSDRDSGTGEPG